MPYAIPAILGILLQAAFIMVEKRKAYVPAVVLKGLASVCFCLIGFLSLRGSGNGAFSRTIVWGLACGAAGDILLNLRYLLQKRGQLVFMLGIVAFLAGHIVYLWALAPLCDYLAVCLVSGAILAALLLTWIFRVLDVKPAFKIFGVLYIGAISMMSAVAVGNVVSHATAAGWILAVGAVAFLISDMVLIFNTFGKEQKFSMRIANLSVYYLGQLLIAFSLFTI